ncbi:MAG TPA: UDP-2,3-diacylglucosamine diphosphatase [Candidatus Binatia bacterium]|nr:UDP-2,3-diacylglucosamine diphosphatase [Candidatus Binatia bacterium]
MATLFVSDIHLHGGVTPLGEAFVGFLQGPASEAEALYILGDLFDYWIGDAEGLQDHARVVAALAVLTQAGVPVYFQHGNRDFMVGRDFAELSGVQLLRDPLVVDLYGTPTLLSHGDIWCTDDVAYQRWRRFSRRPLAQAAYRALPASLRLRIAGDLRGRSGQKQDMQRDIMDVNEGAVREAFARHGVTRMIHGHTHRPSAHRYRVGEHARERLVLADWRPDHLEYLSVDPHGIRRVRLPATG